MWDCDICQKIEVPNKGKGFRAFVVYDFVTIFCDDQGHEKHTPIQGSANRQIRICAKCLKKDYQNIKI